MKFIKQKRAKSIVTGAGGVAILVLSINCIAATAQDPPTQPLFPDVAAGDPSFPANDSDPTVDVEIHPRLWVDATGSHMIRAKLLSVSKGMVHLLREDNQATVALELNQLSLDDQKYCLEIAAKLQQQIAAIADKEIDPSAVITRQSVRTLELLEESVRDFSAELNAIESRNPTTIQRNIEFAEAANRFRDQTSGHRLQVHFLVDDVQPGKTVSRVRQQVQLVISTPDIQFDFKPNKLQVWMDGQEAILLRRGDVLRMQGRINEHTRNAFATIQLYVEPIGVPATTLGPYLEGPPTSVFSDDMRLVVPFFVESIRRLSPNDAKQFLDAQGATQLPALPPNVPPKPAPPKMGI